MRILTVLTLLLTACATAAPQDPPRDPRAQVEAARGQPPAPSARGRYEPPPPPETPPQAAPPPPVPGRIAMANYDRDAAAANNANNATIAPCAASRATRVADLVKEREAYKAKLLAVRPFGHWIETHCVYDADDDEAYCGLHALPKGLTPEMTRFVLEYHLRGFPSIGSLGRYARENEACEFADSQVGLDTEANVGDARLRVK